MFECSKCHVSDVRLYRPYGEFLREQRIMCFAHASTHALNWGWWVPLIEDLDGSVWGYCSTPELDIQRWNARRENVSYEHRFPVRYM